MDRDEAFKLLRGGPAGIHQWNRRRRQGEWLPKLRGADLRDAVLGQIDLKGLDLQGCNLSACELIGADLADTNLRRAVLRGTDLRYAHLTGANLCETDLRGADLSRACLMDATLRNANLRGAQLFMAFLGGADLSGADLQAADLKAATLVDTNLQNANLTDCAVFGISAWRVELKGANQSNLRISRKHEPTITLDNLQLAQFMDLLLHNEKVREVINTITSKVVLILGRFTRERKAVLDAIREELRRHDYCPVMFDFEKPASRSFTETIRTLAHMARFVIADITDAKSIPQELQAIVPTLRVPVQPLLLSSQREYGMFGDFRGYHWVLELHHYDDAQSLLRSLPPKVIAPAEAKAKELESR